MLQVVRQGKDFSGPFWYPAHRKILRKSRKEEPGDHHGKDEDVEEVNGGNHI